MKKTDQIFFGIDRFLFESDHALKGKKVGLLTNESAITACIPGPRVPTRLALQRTGLHLSCLLINKHGLYLENMLDPVPTTDPMTGLPIINIAGQSEDGLLKHLEGLDAVMVDLPDSGIRYLSNLDELAKLMTVCAHMGLPLWILDRPNPLGGHMKWVEGPLQGESQNQTTTKKWSLPLRHSLTLAELARMWQHENGMELDLNVVPMGGWHRRMMWPQMNLPYTPAHPAIADFRSNLIAACTGLFSGLNVNIGLGTHWPFRVIGAPWIDPSVFYTSTQGTAFRGVDFRPLHFRPNHPPYLGEICGGIMLHITSAPTFRPIETCFRLLQLLFLNYSEHCEWQTSSEKGMTSSPQAFNQMVGKEDIAREIQRLTTSHSNHIQSWTQARNWRGYVRNWLLYK